MIKRSSSQNTTEEDQDILTQYENSVNKDKPYVEYGLMNSLFFLFINKIVRISKKESFSFKHMFKPVEFLNVKNLYSKINQTKRKTFTSKYLEILFCG